MGMHQKMRLCEVLSPVATKVRVATGVHSRSQAANETLQEYIQQLTDLVIHEAVAHLTLSNLSSNYHSLYKTPL